MCCLQRRRDQLWNRVNGNASVPNIVIAVDGSTMGAESNRNNAAPCPIYVEDGSSIGRGVNGHGSVLCPRRWLLKLSDILGQKLVSRSIVIQSG